MSSTVLGPMAFVLIAVLVSPFQVLVAQQSDETPQAVFDSRIRPIFESPNPSSCIQCHLSSVDLKNYILPSHEKTFVSLRDQGLIDLENPAASKILTLIRMGDQDPDEGAKLIHDEMRKSEVAAFEAWIIASCADKALRELPSLNPEQQAGPSVPEDVIRHARKSRVVDSFERNIWSQRMRCFPCHTPHELDANNPNHKIPLRNRRNLFAKLSAEQSARMDIFGATPLESLDYLIRQSSKTPADELPLINLDNPRESLLLLKPISKVPGKDEEGNLRAPSAKIPVSHMGGLKMHLNDPSYKSFVAWLEDYARVVNGEYQSVDELPADNWIPTQQIIRLVKAPPSLAVGDTVQLVIYPAKTDDHSQSDQPIGFTQGTVTPRKMVNGAVFLFAEVRGEGESVPTVKQLQQGRFDIAVLADSDQLLEKDPTAFLPSKYELGRLSVEIQTWQPGFKNALRINTEATLQADESSTTDSGSEQGAR